MIWLPFLGMLICLVLRSAAVNKETENLFTSLAIGAALAVVVFGIIGASR